MEEEKWRRDAIEGMDGGGKDGREMVEEKG